MSWDISFFSSRVPPPSVAEMPKDWHGEEFGVLQDVRDKISKTLPAVDWTDPNWGRYERGSFSYEFNLGSATPCYGFMVHVRGGGEAVTPLVELAIAWSWYMLDTSEGEWLHHLGDERAGWTGFQEYRNRVMNLKDDPDGR